MLVSLINVMYERRNIRSFSSNISSVILEIFNKIRSQTLDIYHEENIQGTETIIKRNFTTS